MMSIAWIVGVGALMYFFMIRPQQRQKKAKDAMMQNMKKGDRVVTVGGLYGIIRGIKDDRVTLEVASEVYVQFTRAAIASILRNEAKAAKEQEAGAESTDDVDDVEYEIEQDKEDE